MRLIGIALLAMAAACAGKPAVTAVIEPPPLEARQLEAQPLAETKAEAPQELPPEAKEAPSEPVADVAAPHVPPPKPVAASKPAAPPAKAPPEKALEVAATPSAAPIARALAAPTLDVADLKARLRETKAFGMLTKIALQNQMDDLVKQFRVLHEGGKGASVGTLRAPFDALVGKVLGLLQEGDASLARAIASSREAIWDILSDPEKFDAAT